MNNEELRMGLLFLVSFRGVYGAYEHVYKFIA